MCLRNGTKDKVHCIKVANVLNRLYFSDNMIRIAICNLKNALLPEGYLFVIDNRKNENSSQFKLSVDNEFVFVKDINRGCDIKDLIICSF